MPLGDMGTYEGYGYRVAAATGVLAAGTVGDIFQFRYVQPNGQTRRRCRILEVRLSAVADSAAGSTAGGNINFSLFAARAWTADGSGGTTILTQGSNGNQSKLRTAQNPSQITARIATTGALTAGTKTLDTQAEGIIVSAAPILVLGATAVIVPDTALYFPNIGSHTLPFVIDTNEGIVVQTTALPAATQVQVGITVLWAEIDGGGQNGF